MQTFLKLLIRVPVGLALHLLAVAGLGLAFLVLGAWFLLSILWQKRDARRRPQRPSRMPRPQPIYGATVLKPQPTW